MPLLVGMRVKELTVDLSQQTSPERHMDISQESGSEKKEEEDPSEIPVPPASLAYINIPACI